MDVLNPSYIHTQLDHGSRGIFALLLADYLELGVGHSFLQDDMKKVRKRMAMFLMDKSLLTGALISERACINSSIFEV